MDDEARRTRTERLARRAADDPDAFEALVRHIRERLVVWISLRLGPMLRGRLSEDDVLQETLLQAHRSLAQFRDQGPGSFQRWMFSLAEHRLKDLHKFHAAQRRDPAREAAAPSTEERAFLHRVMAQSTPSARTSKKEQLARLADGIAALPERERAIVVMRALEERTFKEIAEAAGERHAAVVAVYARALAQLKRDLDALD